MNAVIIDDDPRVIHTVTQLLISNFKHIDIKATANTIEDGLKIIQSNNPDLAFLDINLPDGTGFDLLKQLGQVSFKVIFITGHEEYAVQAFKFSAFDFILKPIDLDELSKTIAKAEEALIQEEENLKIRALLENMENTKKLKRIILRTSDFLQLIDIEDIIRCEADNNYTNFFLKNGQKILVSKTIKEYSKLLGSSGFIRVHQSHLINSLYIDKYVKGDGGYILMKDNTDIPISQQMKQVVLKVLEQTLYG